MTSKKGWGFTLLELLLSLTILMAIGGAFAYKGWELVSHYRFRRELDRLATDLYLSFELAKTYNMDVEVTLQPSKKGLVYQRFKQDHFHQLDTLFRPIRASQIRALTLVDETPNEPFTLHFRHTGWIDEQVVLLIFDRDEKYELHIHPSSNFKPILIE
ncbi:MAG: hypothetical protein S4CHLAM102_07570 [Chlamydiia bacterium]|nr:hypothetical protein [Chlamydiia bacterium]